MRNYEIFADAKILQNYNGDLLEVSIDTRSIDLQIVEPTFVSADQSLNRLANMHFSTAPADNKFVYAGDYFCWKDHDKVKV